MAERFVGLQGILKTSRQVELEIVDRERQTNDVGDECAEGCGADCSGGASLPALMEPTTRSEVGLVLHVLLS